MTALPPDFDFTVNSFMQLTFNSNFISVMAAAQESGAVWSADGSIPDTAMNEMSRESGSLIFTHH